MEVEAKVALSMVRTQITPSVQKHIGSLAQSISQQQNVGLNPDQQTLRDTADLQQRMQNQIKALDEELQQLHQGDTTTSMNHAANVLLPRLLQLREVVDALEGVIDDDRWPLPSYREMLFVS